MLSKKSFTKLVNHIIELQERDANFEKALKAYGDTDFCNYVSTEPAFLVGWLKEVMGLDKEDDLISWWLWDAPDAGNGTIESCTVSFVKSKHEPIVVKTPDDVYDLVVTCDPKKCPDAQAGIDFALSVVDELRKTNKKTHNLEWRDRDALLGYTHDKIDNEWRLRGGES